MRASLLLVAALLPCALAGFDWGAVTSTAAKQQGDVSAGGRNGDASGRDGGRSAATPAGAPA